MNLDMKEYRLLCRAQELKNIDRQFWVHLQAYAGNKATLRDRKGRLVYGKFDKLFDYEEALSRKNGKKQRKPSSPRLDAYMQYMKMKKGGKSDEQQ